MVRAFAADLHVHTYLSPCAAREMSPQAIVGRCLELGLDIIAPADHNSAANVEAVASAAAGTGLVVICGMEVCTKEEVHVLTLLPDARAMAEWESKVASSRAPGTNVPAIFGEQWVFSVSYTHLDVYKRQLLNCVGRDKGNGVWGRNGASQHEEVF